MSETIIEAAEAVEEKKPYEFRKLCSDDIFLMLQVIKKIGIKEFKSCFEDEAVGKTISKLFNKGENDGKENDAAIYAVAGVVLMPALDIIIGALPKCKDELYNLLGEVSNLKADEIRKLDAVVFVEMVIDFFKKPEFPDFFKVVSKLFK